MSPLETISAILLIISCIFITCVVLAQESKKGMSQAITGQTSDNYYSKNSGRTKEAKLLKATKVAATLFFIVTLGVNLATTIFKPGDDEPVNDVNNAAVVTDADTDVTASAETAETAETASAETASAT